MNRVRGKVLAGLIIAAGCGALGPACAHDDTTIFIRDVLAQPLVAPGQVCTFTSDPTQASIPSGVLDIGVTDAYLATFLVGNQMVPESNPSTPATETSFVSIQGAVVRITDASGVQITTYTTLASTTIPPSVGTTPGYAPINGVTIVDPGTTGSAPFAALPPRGPILRVVTYTRFFGKTLGGQSVESNEFEFPVDICRDCLIVFPSDEESPNFTGPNCGNPAGSSTTTSTSVPCAPGQDSDVNCNQCLFAKDCVGSTTMAPGIVDAGGGG